MSVCARAITPGVDWADHDPALRAFFQRPYPYTALLGGGLDRSNDPHLFLAAERALASRGFTRVSSVDLPALGPDEYFESAAFSVTYTNDAGDICGTVQGGVELDTRGGSFYSLRWAESSESCE